MIGEKDQKGFLLGKIVVIVMEKQWLYMINDND